ncbi:hypothetical protein L1987_57893 [Smallanthus sonchifolius]|uniref:Uncharacterized protein n=1 Tax=Smallanthus sonchifolius TaxID=185202 RepID=A0ACB9DE96_9ASTR|nr:hypothetical protein L1987_57893 [Smallanthus sonchifolius]
MGIAQKIWNIDGKLIASSGIFKNSSSILGKYFDNVNLNFKPNADKLFDSANITIPTSTSELDINDYDSFRKSQDQTIRVNDEVGEDVGSMKEGSSSGLTSGSLKKPVVLGTDDNEEVENVYDETAKFMEAGVQSKIYSEGASTPSSMGFNG